MKKMLFVTKLILDTTNEEIHVFMSLEDFKKHAFVKKNNLFIPYADKKLLDVLNNVEKVMYHQETEEIIEEESNKKHKKKLSTKEKIQKALAGLGIAVTLITFEPAIVEVISYSLKRVNSFSHCTLIDEKTTSNEFMEQFAIAINKNQDYKEEERKVIIEGYAKYIDDWGYILDEVDKEYILQMAETVNINRGAKLQLEQYGGQYFGFGKIGLKNSNIETLGHESAHAFSDRGLIVGSINGYGLGYALNEGINTSINDAYIIRDNGYSTQRKDVVKLSLLTENEDFIKAYQKEGPEYFCRMVAERNPNISYFDVLRYLSMMDIEIHLDTYKKIDGYRLPKTFFEEKEELYNKMFKAKYGYDFSESIMGEILNNEHGLGYNFLQGLTYTKNEGFTHVDYCIPKEMLSSKSVDFDYSKFGVNVRYTSKYSDSLAFLASESDVEKYASLDEFCRAFASKYSQTEEEVNKVKSVFTQELCEENFDYYMDYALDRIIKINASPEFIACYIKELYFELRGDVVDFTTKEESVNNFEARFNMRVLTSLTANNLEYALNLYVNSDIRFKNFDLHDFNKCILPTEYNMLSKTDNYILMENGMLVVKVSEDEFIYDGKYGTGFETKMSWSNSMEEDQRYIHFFTVSEQDSEKFDEFFGDWSGTYYYADMKLDLSPEQLSSIDMQKISIFVASSVKTEDLERHR